MNRALVEKVVNAVLYEGHILYPYRPSSKKNRQRFTFGRVYPQDYSITQNGAEPCAMQMECLVRATSEDAVVAVTVRFLQPVLREVGAVRGANCANGAPPAFDIVPELRVDGRCYVPWHEAVERTVEMAPFPVASLPTITQRFDFAAEHSVEVIRSAAGTAEGVFARQKEAIAGDIEIGCEKLAAELFKLRVRIVNETPVPSGEVENQEALLRRLFASTHTILHVTGGEFISLLDPPAEAADAARQCKNIGQWPVLIGDEKTAERDTLLASPIILYDYPQINPESAGDLFDGTEIDEILTLRVLTMTDDEKAEMRDTDAHARRILDRTASLSGETMSKMHGAMRDVRSAAEEFFNPVQAQTAVVRGVTLKAGDRVRISPKSRADVMDIAFAGKIGIIEAVEHDVEERVHFALVVEDDPGRELGLARFPGHRFFFSSEEVEPLEVEG